jgi:hypothetical protein
MILTMALMMLTLVAGGEDDKKMPASPEVTSDEQIQLLILQIEDLSAENQALKMKLRRADQINRLMTALSKRGCIVEEVKGRPELVQCKPPAPKQKGKQKDE